MNIEDYLHDMGRRASGPRGEAVAGHDSSYVVCCSFRRAFVRKGFVGEKEVEIKAGGEFAELRGVHIA